MKPGAAGRGETAIEADGAVENGAVWDVTKAARPAGDAGCGILARLLDAGTAASCQE
jgi:hypothetical protein